MADNKAPHYAPVDIAGKSEHLLAYGTIVPMPLDQPLPIADFVDIAAESAIQRQLGKAQLVPAEQPEIQPEIQLEENAAITQGKGASAERSVFATRTGSVSYLPFTFRSDPDAITPVAKYQTPNVMSLLQPEGFHRPHWQDMGFDQHLQPDESEVEPFVVMLDPGHGGSDPGSKGHNGLLEKDLTLDIARRVRLFLTEFEHIDVRLTRNHDYGLSRQSRVNAIQRSAADMVISLHFNHLPQTDINLVESYYAGPKNIQDSLDGQQKQTSARLRQTALPINLPDFRFTEGSKRLANTLQQRVFAEVSLDNEHVQNAGVKQETLFVLTRSFTPGVLLEISCLSHPDEADKLAVEAYRDRLAAALADGIRHHHDALQRLPLDDSKNLGV